MAVDNIDAEPAVKIKETRAWIGASGRKDNVNVVIGTQALEEVLRATQEATTNQDSGEIFYFLLGKQVKDEDSGQVTTVVTSSHFIDERYISRTGHSVTIKGEAWSVGLGDELQRLNRGLKDEDPKSGIVGTIHTHPGLGVTYLTEGADTAIFGVMEQRAGNFDWNEYPEAMVHLVYDQGSASSVVSGSERLSMWSRGGLADEEDNNGRRTSFAGYRLHLGFELSQPGVGDQAKINHAKRLYVTTNPPEPRRRISIKTP